MSNKQGGFSLMEVLIASFIMFIALAVFTLVFRGAILSSDKATQHLSLSAYASLLVENVSSELAARHSLDETQGEGKLFDLIYKWRAQVVKRANPPARYFGKEEIQLEHEAKIWRVEIQIQGLDKQFVFEELTL